MRFTKNSHFTPFTLTIPHLSSCVVMYVCEETPLPLGRVSIDFPGVISTDQNGSVPFAVYDVPRSAFGGSHMSVDIQRGLLGYGLGADVSFLSHHQVQLERRKSDTNTRESIRIEKKLKYRVMISLFSKKQDYFILILKVVPFLGSLFTDIAQP